jgi:hypothetical protein
VISVKYVSSLHFITPHSITLLLSYLSTFISCHPLSSSPSSLPSSLYLPPTIRRLLSLTHCVSHSNTYTHTYTCTYTHTHSHSQSHSHSHSLSQALPPPLPLYSTGILCPLLYIFAEYMNDIPVTILLLLLAFMGCLVGGPNNIITSAVAADLADDPSIKGNNKVLYMNYLEAN